MQSFDFDYSVAVIFALLIALGKIVPLLFATVRLCVKEYYDFRLWLRSVRERVNGPKA